MSMDATYMPPEDIVRPVLGSDSLCGVEFFHIYTDEEINHSHQATLDYLITAKKSWDFKAQPIVLIDNYNPTEHKLSEKDVFEYLNKQGALPDFWAYEADMVRNADVLLGKITSDKLRHNYERYIETHGKYPCSLLTASWYLTRLGYLDYANVIKPLGEEAYVPAKALINILPEDYYSVEGRCFEIIQKSEFADALENIQDIFIPVAGHNKTSL